MRCTVLAACVSLLWIATPLPQTAAQRPVRDAARVEPTGTGAIAGIVETDDPEPKPLRRVAVRLQGGGLMTARQTFTGADGRFQFDGLPPGQFTLVAQRSMFMNAEHGARRPGGAGAPIALAAGQRILDTRLRMTRFGMVSGVIYDQNGEPLKGASVEAFRWTMRTGRRTMSSMYGTPSFTDDRGVFQIGGLGPGQYYIAAGQSPDRGPSDLQVISAVDIDRVLQGLKAGTELPVVTYSERHQTFAPVFFPGTTSFTAAQPITLGPGEVREGVNIHLRLVPTARVDGTVTFADGQPAANAQIVATPITEAYSMDLFSPSAVGSAAVAANGRFSYPALAPGRYAISARSPGGSPAASGPLWALTEVFVGGETLAVALTLQPGMTVAGRVMFNGTSKPLATMTGLRVGLTNAVPDAVALGVATQTVNTEGEFSVSGAPPGRYMLAVAAPPPNSGWYLRSASVAGADALDVPFTIEPGRNIDDVVITYTDKPTELTGTLQTPAGDPSSDYFIIVFSADRTFWRPATRRSVMARPASSGNYLVRNLPPGEYCVVAVTDVEQGAWWDPEFLAEMLKASPLRVTLTEGERKTLNLRIGG